MCVCAPAHMGQVGLVVSARSMFPGCSSCSSWSYVAGRAHTIITSESKSAVLRERLARYAGGAERGAQGRGKVYN